MKYIRSFETLAGFQAVQTTLDKPNVSLIEANMDVKYLPYVAPVVQQHDYVEIGGIKWATMNIGANSITDTGLYFQWGDTQGYTVSQVGSGEGQKYFGWEDYKYGTFDEDDNDDLNKGIIKYNNTDNKIVLDASDDAVTVAWGGNWRMPTDSEYDALLEAVDYEYTFNYQESGVEGYVCTDKNDSSKVLFFPKTNIMVNGEILDTNAGDCEVFTWTRELGDYFHEAKFFDEFYNWDVGYYSPNNRCIGLPIRGILDDSNS